MRWFYVTMMAGGQINCVCPGGDESEAICLARRELAVADDVRSVTASEVVDEAEVAAVAAEVERSKVSAVECEALHIGLLEAGVSGVSLAAVVDGVRNPEVAALSEPKTKGKGKSKDSD